MPIFYERMYNYAIYVTYILYIFVIFGVTKYAPQYLETLKNIIKIFVSVLLIISFNPFAKKSRSITEFERKLVFSAGIFLLISTSIISIIEIYILKIIKTININNINNNINNIASSIV